MHCNGGISLGPSVVVGYVMARQQTTYEEALKWVQSRRYCISPNQVSRTACLGLVFRGAGLTWLCASSCSQGFMYQLKVRTVRRDRLLPFDQ